MGALEKTGFFLNQRGEVANQELARELAAIADTAGIAEISASSIPSPIS